MSYESDTLLHEYLLLHFGAEADTLPFRSSSKPVGPRDAIRFPQRCGELVSEWAQRLQLPTLSALDIGCAVGGSTFELAKTFDRVVGTADLALTLTLYPYPHPYPPCRRRCLSSPNPHLLRWASTAPRRSSALPSR